MAGTNRITHISFPNMSDEYQDITLGIADGSLLVNEILLTGGFCLGEVNCNRFEVQLYNISDVSGERIKVWQVDEDTSEEIPIFTGYVDSAKQNRSAYYREIVAYDAFYTIANQNISQWWKSFWENNPDGVPLANLRTSLISYFDLPETAIPEEGYPNDSVIIHALPDEPNLTFSVLLKMICELQGTIPNIDRYGRVEYIILENNIIDISDDVNTHDSMFEEYRTSIISGVWVFNIDDVIVGEAGSPTGNNNYKIQGNLLVSGIHNIDTVAEEIYYAIRNVYYTPANIKMIVSDPTLKLGSYVKVGQQSSLGVYTYVFENLLSGSIMIDQELIAGGDSQLQEKSNYNSGVSSVRNKMQSDQTQYFMISNADPITIGDGQNKRIIDARFTTYGETIAIFHAEILANCQTTTGSEVIEGETYDVYNDNNITVTYIYNGETLAHYIPKQVLTDGNHIIHLLYYIPIQQATLERFEVYVQCAGGSIFIDSSAINASIYGQNIVGRDDFSGLIEVTDQFNSFNFRQYIGQFTDSSEVSQQIPEVGSASDNYTVYSFRSLVSSFTDDADADKDMIEMYNGDGLSEVHCSIDQQSKAWIGPGYVISEDVYNTDHIIVNADIGVEYLVSFNDGPWVGFINGSWVENITMTKSQLEAVTQSDWTGYPFKIKAILSDGAIVSSVIFVRGTIPVQNGG